MGLEFFNKNTNRASSKAKQCFAKGAERGHAESQFYLGGCYYTGTGTKQNFEHAFRWFEAAALGGVAAAHTNIGTMLLTGTGTHQSEPDAIRHFEIAAAAGEAQA